jgi:hypothetical protein
MRKSAIHAEACYYSIATNGAPPRRDWAGPIKKVLQLGHPGTRIGEDALCAASRSDCLGQQFSSEYVRNGQAWAPDAGTPHPAPSGRISDQY